ncbi:MAG: peptidylprolyl isomerase [Tenacibaculum sp.]
MLKFKYFIQALILGLIVYSCGDNDTNQIVDNFDHSAQAIKDNDSIVKFLKNHYFDKTADSIKPLESGKLPLFEDSRLLTREINEFDVNYTYYCFVKEQEEPANDKGFPTVMDSILAVYKLKTLNNTSEVETVEEIINPVWFDPINIIPAVRGWIYAFTHFKGGNIVENNDEPIRYEMGGEGFFILPSGLAYRNGGPLPNTILLYYVNLYDFIKDTDHDSDNIPSIYEDIDQDGRPWNDDTDNDNTLNFLDRDDDNDSVLTRDEDRNKDNDPRNDFNDPENPNLPDYLNNKIRFKK